MSYQDQEQQRIEKFVQEKRDNIAFLNAKNNAAMVVSALIPLRGDVSETALKQLISDWTEWFYHLQVKDAPQGQTGANKAVPGGAKVHKSFEKSKDYNPATMKAKPISEKQIDLILGLALQKGVDDLTRKEVESYDSWQAHMKIEELKKLPYPKVKEKAVDDAEMDAAYQDDPNY